jgi:hypothetical protein
MEFVRFREVNDHEGETWNTWLQVDGNEEELRKLDALLADVEREVEYDFPYSLHAEDVEPEDVVDKLCEYAESGYGRSHDKVTGKFICPDSLGEYADDLYKGGIKDYFS